MTSKVGCPPWFISFCLDIQEVVSARIEIYGLEHDCYFILLPQGIVVDGLMKTKDRGLLRRKSKLRLGVVIGNL